MLRPPRGERTRPPHYERSQDDRRRPGGSRDAEFFSVWTNLSIEQDHANREGHSRLAAAWTALRMVLNDEYERRLEEADEFDYRFLSIIEDFQTTKET